LTIRTEVLGLASTNFGGHAEDLLGVVRPDLVVGDHGDADAHEDRLLVPGLADAVAVDGAGLHGRRHLRRRGDREQHVGVDLPVGVVLVRSVVAGVQPAGGEPVAQLVVVRRDREDHAHLEGLARGLEALHDRLERIGLDRMLGTAVGHLRHVGFICSHTAFETVMAFPFRSMLSGVTIAASVPKPMVAAKGWPASMWAPSSWPSITRSSSTFQLA
jgi:hypothetical protein